MKTLSKQFLVIALTIIINSLYAQDIFYTVSGEIDSQKVGLDSIVIVNTQNGTKLLFDNLSDQPDYVINLSTKTLWGSTGISDLQFENGFNMIKNTAGELSFAVNFTPTEPINISIYNVQGQRIYSAPPMNITAGNSINVQLANMGIYFVKVESAIGSKTFKALGSNNISEFGVALNYHKPLNSTNLKSSLNTYDSDFSFEIGDDLRVSVYKNGYWAPSKTQSITTSISLIYTLEISSHTGTFTDTRNEQTYKTIVIGDQTWFAENLNFETTNSWWYDNSSENGDIYGRLYTWDAAITACPSGWHLPSDDEWTELSEYLINNGYGYDGSGDDIGKSMAATSGWETYSVAGTVGNDQANNNSSGFSALPGGYRDTYDLLFYGLGEGVAWWSSSESSSSNSWALGLYYGFDDVARDDGYKTDGLSARCLRNFENTNTAPIASFTVTPGSGTTITTFAFDASGSTDSEDATSNLQVQWDFDDDGNWDTDWATEKSQNHQYTSAGTYTAKLEVKDIDGLTHQTTLDIIVSDAAGETGTFTDARDDQTYTTIEIGNQVWMAENLKYLPAVVGPSTESYTDPYYYVYDYSGTVVADAKATANYTTYGVLYNWPAAMNSAASSTSNPSGVQGVCPSGWHLPSDSEWTQLSDYLINNGYGYEGSGDDIGKAIASTSGWNSSSSLGDVGYDQATNNSSGFNALPGGAQENGYFKILGELGVWWSATESSSTFAWFRVLVYDYRTWQDVTLYKELGFSIRCVQNPDNTNTAPIASFTVTPGSGTTNTTFAFDASGSTDSEDATSDLQVRWDFDGDGNWDSDWATEKTQNHQYTSADTYTTKLEVKDTEGLTHQTTLDIVVSDAGPETGSFTDARDNQTYTTIEIGSQVWMAENLKYLPAVDGSSIQSFTAPCYYVYGYDGTVVADAKATANYTTYGVLYNWLAAMNSSESSTSNPSGVQGVCPSGWHLPSDSEWTELEDYLINNGYGYEGSGPIIGKAMASTSGWESSPDPSDIGYDQASNNSSGFTALPGGRHYTTGSFDYLGYRGYWWSSSDQYSSYSWLRFLTYGHGNLNRDYHHQLTGYSVRCLKD